MVLKNEDVWERITLSPSVQVPENSEQQGELALIKQMIQILVSIIAFVACSSGSYKIIVVSRKLPGGSWE